MSNKSIFKKTIIFSIILLLLISNNMKVLASSDSNHIDNKLKTNTPKPSFTPNNKQVIETGSCGDNATYTVYDDYSMVISGSGAIKDYSYGTHITTLYNQINSVEIEEGITSIGNFTFCESGISSITIPNTVTTIGNYAFLNCFDLTSLIIPESVSSIGNYSFWYCWSLEEIGVDANNPYFVSIDNILFEKTNGVPTKLLLYAAKKNDTSYTIPNTVTSIGYSAFCYCRSLTSLIISNSVTSIGKHAFEGDGFTSLTIPNSVTSIDSYAFRACSITDLIIPDSVTSFGDYVFDYSKIVTAHIGSSDYVRNYCIDNNINYVCDIEDSVIAEGDIDSIHWSLINNGTLVIDGNGTMVDYTPASNAPWYQYRDNIFYVVIENQVATIGSYAFYGCTGLSSITIGDSVTSIGEGVFWQCSNLSSIAFGDSVKSIGIYAFYGCTSLSSITIEDSVDTIGEYAFSDCTSLTSITIPSSVTSIGQGIFFRCDNLVSINVDTNNSKYMSIDGVLFEKTNNVPTRIIRYPIGKTGTSYTVPISVTSIGEGAFRDCFSLTTITIPNSVTSIGDGAFACCDNLTSITIPNSVISIGVRAFHGCFSLTTITIPNSVTSIGDGAFWCCDNLTTITIPNSVISIGVRAFEDCSSNIVAHIGSSEYVKNYCIDNIINYVCDLIDEYTITFNSNGGTPVDPITQESGTDIIAPVNPTKEGYTFVGWNPELPTTMPNYNLTVTAIWVENGYISQGEIDNIKWFLYQDGTLLINGTGAIPNFGYPAAPWFEYRNSITSIVIKDTITSIGGQSFISCPNLTSITIGDSVTSIGEGAFYGCSNLETVFIPSSVTTIKEGAFCECTDLRYLVVNDSVSSIGEEALLDCPNLTVYIYNNNYVKNYCIDNSIAYIEVDSPFTLADISITPPTKIEYELHEDLDLTSFSIQEIYTSGSYSIPKAINTGYTITGYNPDQSGIQTVTVTYKGVSSIFDVNISHGSVEHSGVDDNINWTLYEDGTLVIDGSGDMKKYTITAGNVDSPWHTYRNSITHIIIGNQITSIGNNAFYNCSNLTSITIHNSVTSIGYRAFYNCSNLTSITIPKSVTSIGSYAFYNCSALTSITIPNSVTSIGSRAFSNCSALTSITIPNSVTSIVDYTFYGCTGLTSITIPDSVTSIGSYVFRSCTGLTSITIPTSVTSIGAAVFQDCTNLIEVTIPDSVTSIGNSAFKNCSNLTMLTMPISFTFSGSVGASIFADAATNIDIVTLTIGTGVGGNYSSSSYYYTPWYKSRNILTSLVLEDGITSIGDYTFKGQSNITQIIIPSTVSSIGEHVFDNCNANLVLASYENTYLQQYCLDNGITYLELNKITNKSMDGTLKPNGTICLNLKVNVDEGVDLDTAYVLVNGTKTLLSDLTIQGGKYVVSTPGLAPKNLGDNMSIRYYDGNDNPISKEITLSVKDYINTLLSGYLNSKTKAFYKSLLNYGAYAQINFNYNTDNLVNANLQESDKDLSSITYDNVSSYAAIVSGSTEGISAYGQSLTLNDEVNYKIYFLLDGTHSINEYVFKDGDTTITPKKHSGKYYYVTISRMAATDLDKNHTITVTLNNTGDLSVSSSVLTYAEITLRNAPTSEQDTNLANLMKAMYKYSIAAKAVLGG